MVPLSLSLSLSLSSSLSLSRTAWQRVGEWVGGCVGELVDRGLNSSRAPPPGPDEVCDLDLYLEKGISEM